MSLQALNLACRRGRRMLFEKLDFTVCPGESLLLRGENGSGKSSLLRILAGLTPPTAGTVRWQDADICDQEAEYHAVMLFIGHLGGLKADLNPIENLDFMAALASGDRVATAADALAQLGLRRDATRLPCRQLSAGQRKRVALARLAQSRAALWLLDEPLTALDTATCRIVEQLLSTHLALGGMLIAATHADIHLEQAPVATLLLGA